eukprot:9435830-Alexandrium_andersonii.AAC.1
MSHSAGRSSLGPRAWPMPLHRGPGAGAGPTNAEVGFAPTAQLGQVAFVDLAAAFNREDLIAHRVGEGVDPPLTLRMAFW